MRNVLDKRCRENQNMHYVLNKFFSPENRAVYEIVWKKYSRAREAAEDYRTAHAPCMLDN
jgi:hypothetical protein